MKSFAQTGRLAASTSFPQAFVALRHTALGRRLNVSDSATKSKLYVTEDFSNTVVTQWGKPLDQYSRPVHWILWSGVTETALILSDYEADNILPLIRDKTPIYTYLITYSAPVTKSMLVFDTLKLYSVPCLPADWSAPTWLVRNLGLFAGRLYFDYDSQYHAVCEAMGLPPPATTSTQSSNALTEMDLWGELPFEEDKQEKPEAEPFSQTPLLFTQEWLAIRRKGQDFSQTMMGEICRGRRLVKEDVKDTEEAEKPEEVEEFDQAEKIEKVEHHDKDWM